MKSQSERSKSCSPHEVEAEMSDSNSFEGPQLYQVTPVQSRKSQTGSPPSSPLPLPVIAFTAVVTPQTFDLPPPPPLPPKPSNPSPTLETSSAMNTAPSSLPLPQGQARAVKFAVDTSMDPPPLPPRSTLPTVEL